MITEVTDPFEDSVRAADPLMKLTDACTPISACNFKVYELAQAHLWTPGELA